MNELETHAFHQARYDALDELDKQLTNQLNRMIYNQLYGHLQIRLNDQLGWQIRRIHEELLEEELDHER
jgi:hypothetical protein